MSDLLRALHDLDTNHEEKLHAVYMERLKLEKELGAERNRNSELEKKIRRLEGRIEKLCRAIFDLRELISAERTVRMVRSVVRMGIRKSKNHSL